MEIPPLRKEHMINLDTFCWDCNIFPCTEETYDPSNFPYVEGKDIEFKNRRKCSGYKIKYVPVCHVHCPSLEELAAGCLCCWESKSPPHKEGQMMHHKHICRPVVLMQIKNILEGKIK